MGILATCSLLTVTASQNSLLPVFSALSQYSLFQALANCLTAHSLMQRLSFFIAPSFSACSFSLLLLSASVLFHCSFFQRLFFLIAPSFSVCSFSLLPLSSAGRLPLLPLSSPLTFISGHFSTRSHFSLVSSLSGSFLPAFKFSFSRCPLNIGPLPSPLSIPIRGSQNFSTDFCPVCDIYLIPLPLHPQPPPP